MFKLNFIQIIGLLAQENHTEMKRSFFVSTKVIHGFLVLIYFGGTFTICNENIPSCDEGLKELKNDVERWQRRCLNENGYEINSSCCKTEKDYFQERMRKNTEMCFYSGKEIFHVLFKIQIWEQDWAETTPNLNILISSGRSLMLWDLYRSLYAIHSPAETISTDLYVKIITAVNMVYIATKTRMRDESPQDGPARHGSIFGNAKTTAFFKCLQLLLHRFIEIHCNLRPCVLFIAGSHNYPLFLVRLHSDRWLKNISTTFRQLLKKFKRIFISDFFLFVNYPKISPFTKPRGIFS